MTTRPFQNLINRIRNSEFVRNALVMITGTGVAQIIPLLIIPVLTRLYTPGEIGLLATFISLFAIFSIIAGGRYEYAIVMPEDSVQGSRLLHLSAGLSLLTGIILTGIIAIGGSHIGKWLSAPGMTPWLWLLPLAVTSQGLFMAFSFALNRNKKYSSIAGGKISQSTATGLLQVLGGAGGYGIAGLILGKLTGLVLSAFWLILSLRRHAPDFFIKSSPKHLIQTARTFRQYPLYNSPLALTNTLSNQMPVLLFVTFFSEVIAGFYAMAIRACYIPVQIVSLAFGQVLIKRLVELRDENQFIYPYVSNTLKRLMLIGLIPFGLLFAAGPKVFAIILGPEWAETGNYIRILTPYVYLTFVSQPLSYIPLLFEEQKKALLIYLVSLFFRIMAILTGIWAGSFYMSLSLYSLAGIFILLYHLRWYLDLCKRNFSNQPAL